MLGISVYVEKYRFVNAALRILIDVETGTGGNAMGALLQSLCAVDFQTLAIDTYRCAPLSCRRVQRWWSRDHDSS